MRFEFKLPDLAEGMVEGEIVDWLVQAGDEVKEEQPVVEVMTDKATVTISSPREGKIEELSYEPGDIAEVGTTLFVMDVEGKPGEAPAPEPEPEAESKDEPKEAAAAGKPKAKEEAPKDETPEPEPPKREAPPVPRGSGKALATPATRRVARELGVDIGQVTGTGPAGRVTKEDVRAYHEGGQRPAASPQPTAAPSAPAAQPQQPSAELQALLQRPTRGEEGEERVKVRGLRRAIYETMTRSTHTAAHFTYVEEIECTNLVASRKRLKPVVEAAGLKITYLPFIAKATLLALRRFPKMNAVMDDEAGEIVYKHHHHLGIAAATEQGLTVPVVRHADELTLLELTARITDVAQKARDGKLSPKEAKGSTFTITSLGKIGGLMATPVINHPEVGILGVHKMEPRAVVRDGEVVARQMMNLSLSFDHRVVDGHEGAAFAQCIKAYLEDPERMLLEMA